MCIYILYYVYIHYVYIYILCVHTLYIYIYVLCVHTLCVYIYTYYVYIQYVCIYKYYVYIQYVCIYKYYVYIHYVYIYISYIYMCSSYSFSYAAFWWIFQLRFWGCYIGIHFILELMIKPSSFFNPHRKAIQFRRNTTCCISLAGAALWKLQSQKKASVVCSYHLPKNPQLSSLYKCISPHVVYHPR